MDRDLVGAQQVRRTLDRLMGLKEYRATVGRTLPFHDAILP